MGDSTVEIMKMYQRAGLNLDDENRDAPDHIAIELEFMYYLALKEIRAIRSGNNNKALEYLQMQHAFHDTYLKPWIEPFTQKIRESLEADFYKLLAMCLSVFMNHVEFPGTVPNSAEIAH